jgi:hypothetical protein
MFPIVMPDAARTISHDIAATALRLPHSYRSAFVEKSLARVVREARSLYRHIVELEDVAFNNMQGFIEDLGVKNPEFAAHDIHQLLDGIPRELDLETFLGELEFETAHLRIASITRAPDVQALANRYGACWLDRANAEFLWDQLEKLRMSFKIYREMGWVLVGSEVKRFDLQNAIEHLYKMLPGLYW